MADKDDRVAFQRLLDGFKYELDLQGKTLWVLFDSALNSTESMNTAIGVANFFDPCVPDPDDHWDERRLEFNFLRSLKEARSAEHARDIYAGSLFLVLVRWIKTLQDTLKIPKENYYEAGESIGGARLAKVIWATANNFRHYEEWKDPNDQAKKNIKILNDAGIRGTNLDFVCAIQVLQIINVKTHKELERKVFVVGDDLLQLATSTNSLFMEK